MKIHEYQAKVLFQEYNIPIPQGKIIESPQDALQAASEIGTFPLVMKAQIHAGGRGKGGGIVIARNLKEIESAAQRLLLTRLVTLQTGKEGKPVKHILMEEMTDIVKELYLGITIDRESDCVAVMASSEGGVDIEKVAFEYPDKVFVEKADPGIGLRPFQAGKIFYSLELDYALSKQMSALIMNLYRLFIDKDCSLAEINPLVVTADGKLKALDAKINFDDNALSRHPEISMLRDIEQEDPLEVEASRYNLNYIKLNGSVGCMVNGAGLAMATMDLIQFIGAKPANFLDVGGGATSQMICEGLKILVSDKDVKVIFINIFGGILRCDTLAKGVVNAARELSIKLPMVIRLEGTNVEEGRRIMADSGLSFVLASGMGDAAAKVALELGRR